MSMDEAKKAGATALFGDKYGDIVRVVNVEGFSIELCGGTHIDNIGKIGLFKIESESGIAAGIRRIEAVTGKGAFEFVQKLEALLVQIQKTVKANEVNLLERVEKMVETLKENEREIESLKDKLTYVESSFLKENAEVINGTTVVLKAFKSKTADELRKFIDLGKEKMTNAVIVLRKC